MIKEPIEVARDLNEVYGETFGGKSKGRYKISRSKLRRLAGRKRLEETTLARIIDAAYEGHGLVVIELGDYFAVIRESVLLNYRPVPKSVLWEFIKDGQEPHEIDDETES